MNITNWFTGVVEDVADPMQQGRVRVRCFNYHSGSQTDIPTQDLPWATCILPVTCAGTSGIGTSATGLVPGSWVFGFFRDGTDLQDPVVLGAIASASAAFPAGVNNGFADPNGFFPLTLGNDMPSAATSSGYGQYGPGVGLNDVTAGNMLPPSSFAPPATGPASFVNGSATKLIDIAKSQLGVVETSKNQGAGIDKYWTATVNGSGGYAAREPWCAAFVCWCVQQSGLLSETDRPKTALALGFGDWARSKPAVAQLRMNPTFINAGDIFAYTSRHVGIALAPASVGGKIKNISGNTYGLNATGCVAEHDSPFSGIAFAITIGGTSVPGGTPATTTPGSVPPGAAATRNGPAAICFDGTGYYPRGDTHQPQTAYTINGQYLNGDVTPYVVVNKQDYSNLKLGSKVYVYNHTTGLGTWAIAGDRGPNQSRAEMSVATANAVGVKISKDSAGRYMNANSQDNITFHFYA